ncbi:MAG TPA: hypothetical protein VGH76_20160 [Actinomycetospora sp.]|uniref:hypothetical protein n=1 Tax=Actinomycetospora sp. TaxID=1872135 RepID=UPI002F3FA782
MSRCRCGAALLPDLHFCVACGARQELGARVPVVAGASMAQGPVRQDPMPLGSMPRGSMPQGSMSWRSSSSPSGSSPPDPQ